MNILILGSGGREHALAWKIKQSPLCSQLFVLPGNPGTEHFATNIDAKAVVNSALIELIYFYKVDMLICGPEAPLADGVMDFLEAELENDIILVGPHKAGAMLESSKDFAKAFMAEFGIPTAVYQSFTANEIEAGIDFINTQQPPIVLKADGLAAGKGVVICPDHPSAEQEFLEMLNGKFGKSSATVVVEQFLRGREFSVFVLTNGDQYCILPIAKDYKKVGLGDSGPNTGGMGSISPVPFVDASMMQKVEERIIKPTIAGLKDRNITYKGFIFIGLIEVEGEPYVIEYNCRLGDPETEVVMLRLQNDLVSLCNAMHDHTLNTVSITEDPRHAACVMLVSGGYPDRYHKGYVIEGLETVHDAIVFHAGTKRNDLDQIVTDGGRVLAVCAYGNSKQEAVDQCMESIGHIGFEQMYFRTDIGFDV